MRHNPLFIGACILTPSVAYIFWHASTSQSPLHRGLYSDEAAQQRVAWAFESQSPLHRGLYSDASIITDATGKVSHNPLFIGACILTPLARINLVTVMSHNPLFIGACILTSYLGAALQPDDCVTIPSSSGPVF